MVQVIIVILVFIVASVYLGRLIYRSFQAKSCVTGCGKCAVVDFEAIEKQIGKKGRAT